jgi:hypothetical protein
MAISATGLGLFDRRDRRGPNTVRLEESQLAKVLVLSHDGERQLLAIAVCQDQVESFALVIRVDDGLTAGIGPLPHRPEHALYYV